MRLNEFAIPSITNSIASAPRSKPNIFWTTVIIVGPSFDDNFADNHIATAAINTTISIGKYETRPSKAEA